MDKIGIIFICFFLAIIIASSVVFIKKIKHITHKKITYKILSVIICILTLVTILITYSIFEIFILEDLLGFKIIDNPLNRAIRLSFLVILNIISNFILLKLFYIKISKTIKNDEIELIGSE